MARAGANGATGDGPKRTHIISRKSLARVLPGSSGRDGGPEPLVQHRPKGHLEGLRRSPCHLRHADHVGHLVVFNIGGNKYRLIVRIFYKDAVILIRHVMTHKEYDRGDWKSEPGP